jgi:hypothetical protein
MVDEIREIIPFFIYNKDRMNMDAEIRAELDQAEAARAAGNEGRARVCARRAAGVAARQYFLRQGIETRAASATTLLSMLAELPDLDPRLRGAAQDLTRRVDPDLRLPAGMDLIAEARLLCLKLSER